MASVDEHVKALLELPPEERERVATLLFESLSDDFELDDEWIEEIRRRAQGIADGTTTTVAWEDVRAEARALLAKKHGR